MDIDKKKAQLYKNEIFQMPDEIKLTDANYINKIIDEITKNVSQGPEYAKFLKDYKKYTTHFIRKVDQQLVHQMEESKKMVMFRESSRIFKEEERNKVMASKIRRVVNFRLEELKRATLHLKKDHKWNICTLLYDQLMKPNLYNKDLLEKLRYLDIPNDLRQKIWVQCLVNKPVSEEYKKQYHTNSLLTVSKFDVQIARDCEEFLNKHSQDEAFDGKMIYCMKVILSYVERKQDRILSDWLFYLAIPLIRVYGNSSYIMNPPIDLLGFYFSIVDIVRQIDDKVDFVSQHDEIYDAKMTDAFMNTIAHLDRDLMGKISELLNLDDPKERNVLIAWVKRFVHSLGFEFLNMRITLFIWDQMIMKAYPMGMEIYLCLSVATVCIRNELLTAKNWQNFLELFYKHSKTIEFKDFTKLYKDIFNDFPFYNPVYDNVDMQDLEYSHLDETEQLLQSQIIDNTAPRRNEDGQIKKPKFHSTLLKGLAATQETDELGQPYQKKKTDPRLEMAAAKNLIQTDNKKYKQQEGIVPFINTEEDEDDVDDI